MPGIKLSLPGQQLSEQVIDDDFGVVSVHHRPSPRLHDAKGRERCVLFEAAPDTIHGFIWSVRSIAWRGKRGGGRKTFGAPFCHSRLARSLRNRASGSGCWLSIGAPLSNGLEVGGQTTRRSRQSDEQKSTVCLRSLSKASA